MASLPLSSTVASQVIAPVIVRPFQSGVSGLGPDWLLPGETEVEGVRATATTSAEAAAMLRSMPQTTGTMSAAFRRYLQAQHSVVMAVIECADRRRGMETFVRWQEALRQQGQLTRLSVGEGAAEVESAAGARALVWRAAHIVFASTTSTASEARALMRQLVALAANRIPTTLPPTRVFVNAQEVAMDLPPLQVGAQLMLPVKPLFTHLGYEVMWLQDTFTIDIRDRKTHIGIPLDRAEATVNGQKRQLPQRLITVHDRAYASPRVFQMLTGCRIRHQVEMRRVLVSSVTYE